MSRRKKAGRLLGLGLGLGVMMVIGLALIAPPVARSATIPVEADIAADTTWTTGNTYVVTGTVSVLSSAVLTIEHGVTVTFNANAQLSVQGQLLALGTATSGITFTANTATPARGFWNGIGVVNASNNNEWHYCVVEYADTGLDFGDSDGNLVTHCVFRHNGDTSSGGAITGVPDGTDVLYSTFYDNQLGISFEKALGNHIRHNAIHDCSAEGIRLERTTSTLVRDNVIRDNAGHGVYANQQSSLSVLNNVVRNNGGDGGLYVSTRAGGGAPTIYDNVFCGNAGYEFQSQHVTSTIDVAGNWWGTNAPLTGTHVAGDVDFNPWITLAVDRAPASLPPDGTSTAVITVTLRDTASHDVPDGSAITLTADLGSVAPGVVTTTAGLATATYTAGATPGTAVITATDVCGEIVTTTVSLQAADVGLRKDGGPATARPGDFITYTVTFSNSGAIDAANVRITDTLPVGTVWYSDTAAGCGLTRLGTTSPVVYTRANVTPSCSCSFTVVVSLTGSACGAGVFNTGAITTTSPDTNPANNSDTSATTLVECLDLALVKNDNVGSAPAAETSQRIYELIGRSGGNVPGATAWRPCVYEGDVVTYTIAYANVGAFDATGVVITEVVPTHTTFVGPAGWSQIGSSDVYSHAVGSLPHGHGGVVYFVVRIDSPLPPGVDTVVNRACVFGDQPDDNPQDNCSSDSTPVHTGPHHLYLPLVLKVYSSPPSPPPPGSQPWVSDVKANATTGRVYVASPRWYAVHVIQDSLAHTEAAGLVASVTVGKYPTGLAVVTTTNKTYATNMYDWTVSVIGGGNTVIATIPVRAGPVKAAAHNRDARVYTTNYWQVDDGVTAINSHTDAVLYHLNRTHATYGRYGIDVNPDNDEVYVAARDAGLIGIFYGDWPAAEPLIFKLDPPRVPFVVAYNPATGHLFVTCGADDLVVVLDPAAIDLANARTVDVKGQKVYVLDESNAGWVATIPVGDGPEEGVAVNPRTNRVYVTNMHSDTVSVIQDDADPANIQWLVDIPVGDGPRGVGVHPGFNHVYVGNAGSNCLCIIDGATNAVIQTILLPGS